MLSIRIGGCSTFGFQLPCENWRLGGQLNPSMANFEVLCGRGRASGKRFRCQSLCEWIPRRRRSCLQKRRRLWGKVILLDAHGGSVNFDANSSNEQGPSRNPESQNVGNRLNPKGKVDNEGGESSVKLALVQQRIEEMKYKISELKFMLENGFSDARANKRGSVGRRSTSKGPVRPTNKRMNRIMIVDCKDGDSPTSQLQSSSVRGTERIHPPHMQTGLLIDVDDVREETCKHWSSRNRAEKKGVRLVRRNQVLKIDDYLDTNIIGKYMERLWKNLPEAKQKSCTFLDCLWFSMYLEEALSFNVLKWTKAKNIFATQYVFIPIVHWSHWNLLILCHFGEGFGTPTRSPCILLLDSLKETNPNRLEPLIRNDST